ncbi:TRADD-N-associated membrane domain-containing protein [Nostoc sp. 'Lobaria pulmonaria (5183) cyanobiont']|uniref:TRADD-N-associated membrane domain-containing protein n=1 Tax=Nostoc sp. 'Lobaria pulmonaria (5183) cyanobiont' TaxID=1618022 RepID=UPI003FA5FB72
MGIDWYSLSLITTALSACISLIGAGFCCQAKVTEGTFTLVEGMATSVQCIRFAKEANDRLDKTLAEMKDGD